MQTVAAIYFGAVEKDALREFWKAMNGAEIITVSKEDIDKWYEEEITINKKFGLLNRMVLHNDEEKKRFELIMKTFFPNKEYYYE